MTKTSLSSGQAFFLGIMACMVAVLCVTIEVIAENMQARIIMASIWIIISIWWLIQAYLVRKKTANNK